MFQSNKIKFIDLSVCNRKFTSVKEERENAKITFGYLDFLSNSISPQIIRLGKGAETVGNFKLLRYNLNGFLSIFNFIKQSKGAIILFHGFTYPISFLCLNFFLRKDRKWIVQHHAEQPSKNNLKRYLQKKAYSKADAYLFVDKKQAKSFLREGIVKSSQSIFEVMECSTSFQLKDKGSCREQLNIEKGKLVFIYVSGLDQNKDPMCMLRAIHEFHKKSNNFSLYMFYNKNDLLPQVEAFINENQLTASIFLKGAVENSQLENWYNAADFYISTSHSEGSGVALAEAMACGCIPIVSDIPSFQKITGNGQVGFLFEKGNPNSLAEKLLSVSQLDIASERIKTNQLFHENISFEAIGRDISKLIAGLHSQV